MKQLPFLLHILSINKGFTESGWSIRHFIGERHVCRFKRITIDTLQIDIMQFDRGLDGVVELAANP